MQIDTASTRLGVIGLGYVGLPVACMFARAGFRTTGVDVDADRVETIRRGENPIRGIEPGLSELVSEVIRSGRLMCSTDMADLRVADVVIVCVQTPVDDSDHLPRYQHLRAALRSLGGVLKDGALVIVESTLAPGTMARVVIPELETAAGGPVGQRFYAGHCPERVMPGRLLYNLENMDRVAGGITPQVGEAMRDLYRHIVRGTVDITDILTAELVKTTENAYRDVQIAFANEVARICEAVGGDVWKVRELVNKSPGRHMLFPGAGVGGHCIPKDPWLLIANAGQANPKLIPVARAVNRAMPEHVLDLLAGALAACNLPLEGAVVAVLGYAYREDSDDTRDTPSAAVVELLQQRGAQARIHDPYVPGYQTRLEDVLKGAQAAVLMVAHEEYRRADWENLSAQVPVLIDTRQVLPPEMRLKSAQVRLLGRAY